MTETAKTTKIEAHGIKGIKSTPWRKTFKNENALMAWADKHDAEIYAIRDAD